MQKCRTCGCIFEEPVRNVDWVEFWGSNVPMVSYSCPSCDDGDFDDQEIVEEEEENEKLEILTELRYEMEERRYGIQKCNC